MNPTNDINARLKSAVNSVAEPPYLESRIRSHIRAAEAPRSFVWKLIPAGMALAVFLSAGIAYQLGHLRLTANSQESYIVSVSNRVATLMRVGLGDHLHCSVFRKLPKDTPSVEQFIQKMAPQYSGLIPIVRDQVPADYKMIIAHQCRYHGRRFVHLSLEDGSNRVSLMITQKHEGESFDTEGLIPELVQSGIPVYQSGVQRFQIAAFESRDFLVYFVSDLPKDQNTKMMASLAPQVKDFLKKLEL